MKTQIPTLKQNPPKQVNGWVYRQMLSIAAHERMAEDLNYNK